MPNKGSARLAVDSISSFPIGTFKYNLRSVEFKETLKIDIRNDKLPSKAGFP